MTSSDCGMSWFQRLDLAALRLYSHGVTAMFLLVMLAQQGTAQQADDKGDAPNHKVETPVEHRTSFSCVGRVAGYYADVSSGCQMYHMCDLEGRRYTYSCPNETLFQQRLMICDHWYMVNCNNSEQDYAANELIGQKDKPFVGPEKHLYHREPVYFFTTQQNPGSLQLSNWFLVVTNQNQENSAPIINTVPYSGQPINRSQEVEPSNNVSMASHSSTSRKARDKNINTTESQISIPQISNSTNVTETMISDISTSSQTRPISYKIDPFSNSSNVETMISDIPTSSQTRPISYKIDPFSNSSNVETMISDIPTSSQTRPISYKIDPFSNSSNVTETMILDTPTSSQTRPISYKINPFPNSSNVIETMISDIPTSSQTRPITYKIDPFSNSTNVIESMISDIPTSSQTRPISYKIDPFSNSTNVIESMISDTPTSSQTRPIAYRINPFFRDLFLRTTPATPQNMTDISIDSDTSHGPNNTSAEQKDDENFTVSRPPDESDDLSSLKFSSTRILSQQLSTTETKEVSLLFENPEVDDTPSSFIQHKVPEAFTNNSVLQYLAKTFTVSASTAVPHNTEQTTASPENINDDESKGVLNDAVRIRVLDPRRMFFIPETDKNITKSGNYDLQTGNLSLLFIHVPLTSDNVNQSVMHFRADATVSEGRNPNCVRCHPSFLLPGTCNPCVIIR